MKFSTLSTAALCCAAMLTAGAASAQVMLYEHDNFNGRSVRASNSISNLGETGFNDRASSAVVRNGKWQLCDDAYFRGRCVTLAPGEYPSLGNMGLNDKVSSVRDLGWTPDGGGGWVGDGSSGTVQGNPNDGYRGEGNPGGGGRYEGGRYDGRDEGGRGGNWGSQARAILYAGYNLSGETFFVRPDGINNLERAGFNDKARSLRVEGGYWLFCTDADFQGDCHTYAPGDYASLPGGQNHKITSGRRVSRDYPYRSNPNWR